MQDIINGWNGVLPSTLLSGAENGLFPMFAIPPADSAKESWGEKEEPGTDAGTQDGADGAGDIESGSGRVGEPQGDRAQADGEQEPFSGGAGES